MRFFRLVSSVIVVIVLFMPIQSSANLQSINLNELYEVRTLSGNTKSGASQGTLKEATYFMPSSITQLKNGSFLIADTGNHLIRLINEQQVSTYSGNMLDYKNGEVIGGYLDGTKEEAYFNSPGGMVVTSEGDILVADRDNHAIRKISSTGIVTTVAGNGELGLLDGPASEAAFYYPSDVAIDKNGVIYVADTLNHVIRKIDQKGNVTTLNAPSERIVEYTPGAIVQAGDLKDGPLAQAYFNEPTSLAVDQKGNLYVSDSGNQRIRYIDFSTNIVSTVAGGGELSSNEMYVNGEFRDGKGDMARFSMPLGIHLTEKGALLIADSNNHSIRILHDGFVTTLTGKNEEYGKTNGILSHATFNVPSDVFQAQDGSILVTDTENHLIRIIQKYQVDLINSDPFQVFINGKALQTKWEIIDGRIYIPVRVLMNYLGYDVQYASYQIKVTINKDSSIIISPKDQSITFQTGQDVKTIKQHSFIQDETTYIPVRFMANELGFDVQWDSTTEHVIIRSKVFE